MNVHNGAKDDIFVNVSRASVFRRLKVRLVIKDRKGEVTFSQVFVHNRPHGCSFTVLIPGSVNTWMNLCTGPVQ